MSRHSKAEMVGSNLSCGSGCLLYVSDALKDPVRISDSNTLCPLV